MIYVIIFAVLAVACAVLIHSHIGKIKDLERGVRDSFGKPPKNSEYYLSSIETYHVYKAANTDTGRYIDSITWDDLDMDKVFRRINVCRTSVGEEYLYNCLHEPHFEQAHLKSREAFISRMEEQPEERFKIQMRLARLGKTDFNGVADLIYKSGEKPLRFPAVYNILAVMPLLCAGLIFVNAPAGIIFLIMSFAVNTAVVFKTKRKVESAFTAVQYFLSMIWCCGKLLKLVDWLRSEPLTAQLQETFQIFRPLMKKGLQSTQRSPNETGMLSELLNLWFLTGVRNYNGVISGISKNREQFHDLYKTLGEIDLAICVLSFRKSLPFYSTPVFHDENSIKFEEIYHPLLSEPVPNSGIIKKNSIITGSNASGKSTFIKTVAVNGILAQTVFTCAAKEYSAKFALVMTSMALKDDISEGESYFITEIKSLKRILDKIRSVYCVCFIDEILRGTNTIERVAASASVLNYLNGKDCLCLAASHDIELAEMLDNSVDNYHFREHITEGGMMFDYKINDGISNTRNAIKLLRYMNFESAIVENAEKLAER